MVHAPCHRLHHALHLQREKEGCQLSDGDVCLYADYVQLQVVSLLQQTDYLLFVFRQVREQLAFYGVWLLGLRLPTYLLHKILRRGDESGSVVTNHAVATF